MSTTNENRSVADLLSEALHQVSSLVQSELRLAKAELGAKAAQASIGIGLIAGGGLVSLAAFTLLLMALAAWFVALGLSPPIANLAAAIIGLALSGALIWFGMSRLKPENLKPNRTLDQLGQDAAAVKEQAR